MNTTILRVLVGSRAHGLATEDSDYDYRGVWVRATRELLALGAKAKTTQWTEADKAKGEKLDDTSWELGHFLELATHCNPTILEVFAAPVLATQEYHHDGSLAFSRHEDGRALRALLPYVWNPRGVRDAFLGYAMNQQKKFLAGKDGVPAKFACAYLRVLYQGWALLRFRQVLVDFTETPIFPVLQRWRAGELDRGEVVTTCDAWQQNLEAAADACRHQPDLGKVNDYLLDVRKRYW